MKYRYLPLVLAIIFAPVAICFAQTPDVPVISQSKTELGRIFPSAKLVTESKKPLKIVFGTGESVLAVQLKTYDTVLIESSSRADHATCFKLNTPLICTRRYRVVPYTLHPVWLANPVARKVGTSESNLIDKNVGTFGFEFWAPAERIAFGTLGNSQDVNLEFACNNTSWLPKADWVGGKKVIRFESTLHENDAVENYVTNAIEPQFESRTENPYFEVLPNGTLRLLGAKNNVTKIFDRIRTLVQYRDRSGRLCEVAFAEDEAANFTVFNQIASKVKSIAAQPARSELLTTLSHPILLRAYSRYDSETPGPAELRSPGYEAFLFMRMLGWIDVTQDYQSIEGRRRPTDLVLKVKFEGESQ